LAHHKRPGKTITLKLKYSDFTIQTRSKTLHYYVSEKSIIYEIAKELLYQERLKDSVRLIGVTLSNFRGATPEVEESPVAAQLKIPF
jgi:DNA polymerase-4